jgi:hypothetical protein
MEVVLCITNFYPLLGHERSEGLEHHTSDLVVLYTTSNHQQSILLTADLILLCIQSPIPHPWYTSPHKNVQSPGGSLPPLFHVTSCIPAKSNLCFAVSLATGVNEPFLLRLHTFHVSILCKFSFPQVVPKNLSKAPCNIS